MKTFIRTFILLALVSAIAPSVLADAGPFTVPDGGSTAVMLVIALAGAGAIRKFRR